MAPGCLANQTKQQATNSSKLELTANTDLFKFEINSEMNKNLLDKSIFACYDDEINLDEIPLPSTPAPPENIYNEPSSIVVDVAADDDDDQNDDDDDDDDNESKQNDETETYKRPWTKTTTANSKGLIKCLTIDTVDSFEILEQTIMKQKRLARMKNTDLRKKILLKRTFDLVCEIMDRENGIEDEEDDFLNEKEDNINTTTTNKNDEQENDSGIDTTCRSSRSSDDSDDSDSDSDEESDSDDEEENSTDDEDNDDNEEEDDLKEKEYESSTVNDHDYLNLSDDDKKLEKLLKQYELEEEKNKNDQLIPKKHNQSNQINHQIELNHSNHQDSTLNNQNQNSTCLDSVTETNYSQSRSPPSNINKIEDKQDQQDEINPFLVKLTDDYLDLAKEDLLSVDYDEDTIRSNQHLNDQLELNQLASLVPIDLSMIKSTKRKLNDTQTNQNNNKKNTNIRKLKESSINSNSSDESNEEDEEYFYQDEDHHHEEIDQELNDQQLSFNLEHIQNSNCYLYIVDSTLKRKNLDQEFYNNESTTNKKFKTF